MANIYKMDEDYISAESVYDRTHGKKQNEINAEIPTTAVINSLIDTRIKAKFIEDSNISNLNADSLVTLLNRYNTSIPDSVLCVVIFNKPGTGSSPLLVFKLNNNYGFAIAISYYAYSTNYRLNAGTWAKYTG